MSEKLPWGYENRGKLGKHFGTLESPEIAQELIDGEAIHQLQILIDALAMPQTANTFRNRLLDLSSLTDYNASTGDTRIIGELYEPANSAIWEFLDRMCDIRDAYIKAHIKETD